MLTINLERKPDTDVPTGATGGEPTFEPHFDMSIAFWDYSQHNIGNPARYIHFGAITEDSYHRYFPIPAKCFISQEHPSALARDLFPNSDGIWWLDLYELKCAVLSGALYDGPIVFDDPKHPDMQRSYLNPPTPY